MTGSVSIAAQNASPSQASLVDSENARFEINRMLMIA